MIVCSTCNDTHLMTLGDDQEVLCTRCPVPCQNCRGKNKEGYRQGAYCDTIPCPCLCHKKRFF